jgi:2-keto-4-pentenoate hydratase/2-oxohepta-3-ene-1,7-dioic acid hydratase in catechol pathway
MRFVSFCDALGPGLGALSSGGNDLHGFRQSDPKYPGDLVSLLRAGPAALAEAHQRLLSGERLDAVAITYLPPLPMPGKIICVGLNYADHSAESGFKQPDYPTLFARFASSLIGHRAPMIRPQISKQLDYEGEVVAVIGKKGRHIAKAKALEHIAGYSIFNEGSVRDYQFKAPQWTVGKNFDGTGAFGPAFVTADEVPSGARGLKIETRLNGETMQSASTDDMVFDVASLVSIISEAITLEPGDLIVTGTPAGVGLGRRPPLFMKPGDVCEVEVEGLGLLTNFVAEEAALAPP